MIFLCGIRSEPSLGLVTQRLEEMEAPHLLFHQRRFAEMEVNLEVTGGQVLGEMRFDDHIYRLEDFTAVYTRLMDYRLLPEIEKLPADSPSRLYCQNLHGTVMQWYEIAPGRVLNRSHEVSGNYSKPLQSQLIQECGFATPDTLVTNDPQAVRDFKQLHGGIIYKSTSYMRSIVRLLDDEDMVRLSALRACPVQFQQFIEGDNLRVHTIGERVFPTRISASAVDYRYAYKEGEAEKLEAVTLTDELAEKCLILAAKFGLEFAGIDLKVTADGDIFCLEVNPSPAFSYYEMHTGQPISRAVAEHLAAAE